MKKTVIYARVATQSQLEKDNKLGSQVNELKAFAKKKGYRVNWVFKEVASGLTQGTNRAFSYLLDLVEQEEIKVILCRDISRITRSYCDWKTISKLFKDKNVKIVSLDGVNSIK